MPSSLSIAIFLLFLTIILLLSTLYEMQQRLKTIEIIVAAQRSLQRRLVESLASQLSSLASVVSSLTPSVITITTTAFSTVTSTLLSLLTITVTTVLTYTYATFVTLTQTITSLSTVVNNVTIIKTSFSTVTTTRLLKLTTTLTLTSFTCRECADHLRERLDASGGTAQPILDHKGDV